MLGETLVGSQDLLVAGFLYLHHLLGKFCFMSEKQKRNLKIWGGVAVFIGVLMTFGDSSSTGFVVTFFGAVLFVAGYAKTTEPIKTPEQTIGKKTTPADKERQQKVILGILGVIMLVIGYNSLGTDTPSTPQPAQATVSPEAKQNALKQLKDVLGVAMENGLVTTYEFSDSANVIYVSNLWYTSTVQSKQEFLNSISRIKEQATGYHRFEVRHAQSNEKVAEVTAFSGAVEIYK